MSIESDLKQSMAEELKARDDYLARGKAAGSQDDHTTAGLYEHIAGEEQTHHEEFKQRLSAIEGEGGSKMSESQEKCIGAGMALFRENMSYKKATPVIFRENVMGMVRGEDLKVPHSELAMHIGAAGKELLAFALVGSASAIAVWDDGKGNCQFTHGVNTELMSPGLVKKVQEMWPVEFLAELEPPMILGSGKD